VLADAAVYAASTVNMPVTISTTAANPATTRRRSRPLQRVEGTADTACSVEGTNSGRPAAAKRVQSMARTRSSVVPMPQRCR
jgi:hypothetical protein